MEQKQEMTDLLLIVKLNIMSVLPVTVHNIVLVSCVYLSLSHAAEKRNSDILTVVKTGAQSAASYDVTTGLVQKSLHVHSL